MFNLFVILFVVDFLNLVWTTGVTKQKRKEEKNVFFLLAKV